MAEHARNARKAGLTAVGRPEREGHEALADCAAPVGARHQLLPHVAPLVEADALQRVQVVLQRNCLPCDSHHIEYISRNEKVSDRHFGIYSQLLSIF